MLKEILKKTNLKGYELAQFLGVSEPTIYAWENKNTWPLWALEKCEFFPRINPDIELKRKLWVFHDELLKSECINVASDLKNILVACT